jgi:hypothetical protein
MTSHPSDRPVSALRAHMIEDIRVRGFSEKTRNDYIRNVRAFAAFIGRSPDTATAEDLRRFQHHQAQTGVRPPSINSAVAALRFFFTVTLDRPDLARRLTVVREPRRLPAVLSVEEITLLLQAAPGPKYKAAFATAYGAGRRVSEVVPLKAGNVDSERMLLRVEQGKGRKSLPSRKRGAATPCYRRNYSSCSAPGGGRAGAWVCCCRGAGCFPAAIRSSRSRPASSTAPSTLVPGGGMSLDGMHWVHCRPGFRLPVPVLSRLFRRLFLTRLTDSHAAGELAFFGDLDGLRRREAFVAHLAPLKRKRWFVYAKPPFAGPKRCLPISLAIPTASPSQTAGWSASTSAV